MSSRVAGKPGLDPTLPNVALILNGIERHLCYDFNAIVEAEKSTGVNLLLAAIEAQSATTLRGLLWAALRKEDPTLTIEQVGSWITMRNAPIIHQALITAWFGSIDEQKDEPQGEAPAQG